MLKVFGQVKSSKEFFELFPESIYTTIRTFKDNKYLLFPEEQARRLDVSKSDLIKFLEELVDCRDKIDQRIIITKSTHGGGIFAFIEPISSPPITCRVTSLEYSS